MSDSTGWQRLSVREGRRPARALTDTFSPAATHSLVYWLEGEFGYRITGSEFDFDGLIMSIALACDIELNPQKVWDVSLMRQLLNVVSADDDLMVDVLDATLARGVMRGAKNLRALLLDASSAWTVKDDNRGLVRRVDPTAEAAFVDATSARDPASVELREAWFALYGVNANYSDAWDHAIKAMEAALVPVVAPNNVRATLGTVTAELEKGVKFVNFALGSVSTLGAMTRLAWPNPDRHAGGQSRAPEEGETSAVVHLAVTIVQWVRAGVVSRSEAS